MFLFLVACYATLHPALLVRPSIGLSVHPSVHPSVGSSILTLLFLVFGGLWPHCPCSNDQVISAPAPLPATGVSVYAALLFGELFWLYDQVKWPFVEMTTNKEQAKLKPHWPNSLWMFPHVLSTYDFDPTPGFRNSSFIVQRKSINGTAAHWRFVLFMLKQYGMFPFCCGYATLEQAMSICRWVSWFVTFELGSSLDQWCGSGSRKHCKGWKPKQKQTFKWKWKWIQ